MLDLGFTAPMRNRPGEITITPWSYQSLGVSLNAIGSGASASGAPVGANVVVYVPFGIPEPVTVTKMFNSVTASAGNFDLGIYQTDGTLLVSTGSTAFVGATGQVVDITDTVLARGQYYMAHVVDTVVTLTIHRVVPAAGICQSLGLLQQASVTLPLATNASPATFAKYAQAFIPMFGIQAYRSVGP